MGLIVQKFEGYFLTNTEGILNITDRITKAYREGNSVVAVVSVQDTLEVALRQSAREVNPEASLREMDVLISAGAQISSALVAMAIEKEGYPVVSLTGYQAGITTDSNYGNAKIKDINTERIFRELDRRNIVIVAGSQGCNRFDDITTFGRGGMDTAAVAFAAALKADLCEIYVDVDGIYTADPKTVNSVKVLKDISYDELLELESLGANNLHSRAVELAKKFNIHLVVKSGFNDSPGTVIKEVGNVEKVLVRGVVRDNNVARVAVIGIEDRPGMAFKLFSLLAKDNISVDLILQSIGRDRTKDISFIVSRENLQKTIEIIDSNLGILEAREVSYSDQYSKVSIVGAGMINNPGVAAAMFEALYDVDINIHMITTSEIKISVLVDIHEADRAVNAIHEKFRL
ncbi:MAG: aspartate kinase [Clostridia bacterium]|nr:aspartate kinase [Clostridia bacterium]